METAALVHQLVDEGRVDSRAPRSPGTCPAWSRPVRRRQSRTCCSTPPDFAGDNFGDYGRGEEALGRLVGDLAALPVLAAPGEVFSYCNAGYCVLGHLVATMRGMTWQQAIRQYLVEPLGLRDVALYAEEAVLLRAAAGHVGADGTVQRPWLMSHATAPAGAVSPRRGP